MEYPMWVLTPTAWLVAPLFCPKLFDDPRFLCAWPPVDLAVRLCGGHGINGRSNSEGHPSAYGHCPPAYWRRVAQWMGWLLPGYSLEHKTRREARTVEASIPVLHYAARRGRWRIVNALLIDGADVGSGCCDWDTQARALHEIVLRARGSAGEEPSSRGFCGSTALHLAAIEGQRQVADLLIACGADVNARTSDGYIPLHYAAFQGHMDAADLLLAERPQLDARSEAGDTPLHIAASEGRSRMVELLLAHGADMEAKNNAGRTPLQQASDRGHAATAAILQGYTLRNQKQRSPEGRGNAQ